MAFLWLINGGGPNYLLTGMAGTFESMIFLFLQVGYGR